MKTLFQKLSILLVFIVTLSCSKDDNNTSNPAIQNPTINAGTFGGNFQISDDPQTSLGYIFNSKVTITTTGSDATIKITGNEGFDRTFIGTLSSTSATTSTISITKQTLPVDKTVAGSGVILGNELSMSINFANDNFTVRALTTSPTTFNILGKILMIGTGFIKQ